MRQQILALDSARAKELFDLLLIMREHQCGNPDVWDVPVQQAVEELTSVASVLHEVGNVNFLTMSRHASLFNGTVPTIVIDGDSKRYSYGQLLAKYVELHVEQSIGRGVFNRSFLVVAQRSRGDIDNYVREEMTDIAVSAQNKNTSNDITKPHRPRFFVCQDRLFEGARQAANTRDFLKQQLREVYE